MAASQQFRQAFQALFQFDIDFRRKNQPRCSSVKNTGHPLRLSRRGPTRGISRRSHSAGRNPSCCIQMFGKNQRGRNIKDVSDVSSESGGIQLLLPFVRSERIRVFTNSATLVFETVVPTHRSRRVRYATLSAMRQHLSMSVRQSAVRSAGLENWLHPTDFGWPRPVPASLASARAWDTAKITMNPEKSANPLIT